MSTKIASIYRFTVLLQRKDKRLLDKLVRARGLKQAGVIRELIRQAGRQLEEDDEGEEVKQVANG